MYRKFSLFGYKFSLFLRGLIGNLENSSLIEFTNFIFSTIHHQINENEINLTIRPRQDNFFGEHGEPSHATITIEVRKTETRSSRRFVDMNIHVITTC